MRNRKIIIIGSGGFIGSEIVENFKLNRVDFVPVNRNKIDLTKKNSILKLKKLIKNNDSVIFISAKAPVKNFSMFQENIKMSENFTRAMQNIKLKYFLYVSSDAVYSDSKSLINEKSMAIPYNLHGLMHLTRENIFKSLKSKKCFVRPTLVYGEKDPHNGYGPNRFIRLAQSKKNIKIFGKGEERRDHIFIGDVGKIIFKLFEKNAVGTINLVTGKLYSFYKIANNVKKIYNIKIKKIKRIGPMPHNGYRAFNNKMLKKILPKYKLTDLSQFIKLKKKYLI